MEHASGLVVSHFTNFNLPVQGITFQTMTNWLISSSHHNKWISPTRYICSKTGKLWMAAWLPNNHI